MPLTQPVHLLLFPTSVHHTGSNIRHNKTSLNYEIQREENNPTQTVTETCSLTSDYSLVEAFGSMCQGIVWLWALLLFPSVLKVWLNFTSLCWFQCHEASIAIYSSLENQRLSHWVFISVISMIFCFVIYSLTGQMTSSASSLHNPPKLYFISYVLYTLIHVFYYLNTDFISLMMDFILVLQLHTIQLCS